MADIKETLIDYLKENNINVVDKLTTSDRLGARVLTYNSTIDQADVLDKLKNYSEVIIHDVNETPKKSIVFYLYPATTSKTLYSEISDEDKLMFERHAKEIEDAYKSMGIKK